MPPLSGNRRGCEIPRNVDDADRRARLLGLAPVGGGVKHRAPMLAVLALSVLAPGARADVIADLPSVLASQYTREADVAPVITADGSIILAVQGTAKTLDILRIAPGAHEAQVVETLPATAGTDNVSPGPSVSLGLRAAGQGFFLSRIDTSAATQPWQTTVLRHSLEWFPTPSGPGNVIASCDGDCGGCYRALMPLAADATHALISAATCRSGGRLRAVIRDLATGEEKPFAPPWTIGPSAIEGRFAAGAGVMDWTTGQVFHQVYAMSAPGLLDDGTLIYGKSGGKWFRIAPDETKATAIPVTGGMQAVVGGVILTRSQDTFSAWNRDGRLLGTLDPG